MPNIYYLVGACIKSHPVNILGDELNLDLVFADDMVGCCLVFDNRKDAELYANGVFPISIITLSKAGE